MCKFAIFSLLFTFLCRRRHAIWHRMGTDSRILLLVPRLAVDTDPIQQLNELR